MNTNLEAPQVLRNADFFLDVCGESCPLPILKTKRTLLKMQPGEVLEVHADDDNYPHDVLAFCKQAGHEVMLHTLHKSKAHVRIIRIQKGLPVLRA